MYVFECYSFDFDDKKKKAQINKCPVEVVLVPRPGIFLC